MPMPTSAPGQPAGGPHGELDLRAALRVVRRRIWVIAAALGAVVALTALVTARSPKIYRAGASVLIAQSAPEVLGNVRDVYEMGSSEFWAAREYYETQYNVLRSRPVAEKAAATLGLAPLVLAEELRAAGQESVEARVARDPLLGLPEQLAKKLELLGMDGYSTRAAILEALEGFDAAAMLQRTVRVEPVKDSQLVYVVFEDTSPERAALFANTLASAYIEYNLDQKVAATRSAVDWLSDQMQELKDKVRASELALFEFKRDNNIVSVSMEDRQTMIAETLSQLNKTLSESRAKRIALESKRDQLSEAHKKGEVPEFLEEVIENRLIQDLKAAYSKVKQDESELALRYTAEHPKLVATRDRLELVRRELQSEVAKILAGVGREYDAEEQTEGRLKQAIEEIKQEALAINKREIEYNRLKRERDNTQALYEMVLKRQKEADLTQFLRVNNVRLLEQALPPDYPVRPRVLLNLLMALIIGGVFGLVLGFAVDYLDNTLKSQQQVEQLLGLPFLGILPEIKENKGSRLADLAERDHYILAHPRSSLAECSRTIRTNLLFMSHDNPARRILVTSSGPEEGKSTTTINLAVTMAQSGARTLVIDTDMRRPRLHKSFRLDNDVGISTLILGEATVKQAARPTGVPGLDVITCGPIPPNPAELLHTDAFKRLLDELQERYDRIILDSPPVAAVADALVIAGMVDATVLVVQAGRTTWQAAVEARRRLESVRGRIFGVVLNGIDLDAKDGGEYYYYSAYSSREEPDKPKRGKAAAG